MIKLHSKIRKEKQNAWDKYFDLDTKISNKKHMMSLEERDLNKQRDNIMREMENDPEQEAQMLKQIHEIFDPIAEVLINE